MFKRELPVENKLPSSSIARSVTFRTINYDDVQGAYVWAENRAGVWEPIAKATMPFVVGAAMEIRDAALYLGGEKVEWDPN